MKAIHPHFLGLVLLGCSGDPPDPDSGSDPEDTAEVELAPFDEALAAELQAALEAGLDEVDGVGISLAIQLPDTELLVLSAGLSDLETERALEPTDRFRVASVTKTWIAAAVLQLADDGLLDLDDPLADYVDLLSNDTGITLRQLLLQTAGVPEYSSYPKFQAAMAEPWTDEELVDIVAGKPLVDEPGASWAYSNTHYVLLGMVIAEVTGAPWSEHLESRILAPLGLEETEIPTDDWGQIVRCYVDDQDFTDTIHPSGISAAGVVTASPADLVRWGQAFGSGELLSAESFAAQTEGALEVAPGFAWYGLGTMLVGDGLEDPELELGHNGALNGSASWMGYRAEREATMVVLGNAWPKRGASYDFEYPLPLSMELWDLIEAAD